MADWFGISTNVNKLRMIWLKALAENPHKNSKQTTTTKNYNDGQNKWKNSLIGIKVSTSAVLYESIYFKIVL